MSEVGNYQVQSVISGLASGVTFGQDFIAEAALPLANVGAEEFVHEKFDNSAMLDIDTRRALNEETPNTVPFGQTSVEAKLEEHAMATKIDYRLLNAAANRDRMASATGAVGLSGVDRLRLQRSLIPMYNIKVQLEKAAAALLFTNTSYASALRVTNVDFGGSTIIFDLQEKFNTVRESYGKKPNVGILGWTAYTDLINNAAIINRIDGGATASDPAMVNEAMLARILGVEKILVGTAGTQTKADPGEVGTFTSLWTKDVAAFYYADLASDPEAGNVATPSFGRIAYMNVPETGVRQSIRTWMSPNGKIEFLEVTEFHKVIAQMTCGVHFANTDQA